MRYNCRKRFCERENVAISTLAYVDFSRHVLLLETYTYINIHSKHSKIKSYFKQKATGKKKRK